MSINELSRHSERLTMSPYEAEVWEALLVHWDKRNNARGLPNWAQNALTSSGTALKQVSSKVADTIPDQIKTPMVKAGEAVAASALKPAVEGALHLMDYVNDVAVELNDPSAVVKLARKKGVDIDDIRKLRAFDIHVSDRLLSRNTLKWRGFGILEGGAMGALAMVPVAGLPISLTADIVVIQVLSAAIASRIAYSYGFDAKDPQEQEFIQRLVRRSFVAQAVKARPMHEAAHAAAALKGRIRWSDKLRADHRLVAAIEKLLQHLGPKGAHVSVQSVSKMLPVIGVLLSAGTNAAILGNLAADAQRYCQTRFLSEKYGLELPLALRPIEDDALVEEELFFETTDGS